MIGPQISMSWRQTTSYKTACSVQGITRAEFQGSGMLTQKPVVLFFKQVLHLVGAQYVFVVCKFYKETLREPLQ